MDGGLATAISQMSIVETITVLLGGAFGAIAKDTLKDNALELPYKKDGKLVPGFLGGALVGAFVGLVMDGSFISAALAGYTGSSVIRNLIGNVNNNSRSHDKAKNR